MLMYEYNPKLTWNQRQEIQMKNMKKLHTKYLEYAKKLYLNPLYPIQGDYEFWEEKARDIQHEIWELEEEMSIILIYSVRK